MHRIKILQGVKVERGEFSLVDLDERSLDKTLDVFISYRRSNGSQLASLLKVHLEIRNLSVFLDVDRLEAGKFDNNLLQSIRSARNFVLVLTPGSLGNFFRFCFDLPISGQSTADPYQNLAHFVNKTQLYLNF